jgi:SAM-dependent methyltransferase
VDKTPAEYWNEKFSATDELIYTETVNRFVEELASPIIAAKKKGKVIDLAGGEGRNSVWFAERGWQAENIDISSAGLTKFLAFAERRGVSEKVFANCADATGFESVLYPVDLGVVAYLQIKQESLAEALDCLIDQIKPGGHLIGVWHSRDNMDNDYNGPRDADVRPSVATITEMLSGLPVEIEVLENRDGQVQTKEGLKPSVTLVLKAKVL